MRSEKLRPRASGLITAIWAGQAAIALLWILSSRLDDASFWVWPFGFAWAGVALVLAYRARRQGVTTGDQGIRVQTGLSGSWALAWEDIADVTPEPPGPLVTHLAVVRRDGGVAETPLAKGDTRLREAWSSQSGSHRAGRSSPPPTP